MSDEFTKELEWLLGAEEEDGDQDVFLPTGGNLLRGMVAEWHRRVLYKVYTEGDTDPRQYVDGLEPFSFSSMPNGTNWYFKEYEVAKGVADAMPDTYSYTVWHLEVQDLSTVQGYRGSEPIEQVFGNGISYDAPVTTMRPGKNRHKFQFICLPSLVQAVALSAGWLGEKVYDYDALVEMQDLRRRAKRENDTYELEDGFEVRMIGTENEYKESELWQARSRIWQALGEEDATRFTVGQGGQFDVQSKKLAAALRTIYKPGHNWMRIGQALDPTSEYGVPAVLEIYRSREEAATAAGEETAGTSLPENWQGVSVADWKAELQRFLKANELAGKPAPEQKEALANGELAQKLSDELAVSYAEVEPWL